MPSLGASASTIKTMPKPPNHCIIERQRSTEAGSAATQSNTVAPVDVSPLIDSKTARVGLVVAPVARNGSVPNSVSISHTNTTIRYAMRRSSTRR